MSSAPVGGEPRWSRDLERLVDAAERRGGDLVVGISARSRRELPELRHLDDALRRAFDRSVGANLRAVLARLSAGMGGPTEAPADAQRLAQLWARAGLPLDMLMRTFPIAHEVLWEFFADAIEESRLPAGEQRAVSRRVSASLFSYADGIGRHMSEAYRDERRARPLGREDRALMHVRKILAGDDAAAAGLGYDLGACHLAFVAWGTRAREAARELEPHLDRRTLVVHVDESLAWGWLGGGGHLDRQERRVLRDLAPGDGLCLAFGTPERGADGFRTSHLRALRAQTVAARLGRRVTQYPDVALEVLAAEQADEARDFVRHELGPLSSDDPRDVKLRQTLSAFFSAGSNKSATAAALGVHEQTVTYRLRAVEEKLGTSIRARRAELETALRVRRVLD
jgi:hypothetical protein